MTTDAFAGLATAGGAALVAAMATDAWQTARTCFARLLGRDGRQAALEDQLETQADLVAHTSQDRRDEAREALIPGWSLQLAALLRQHPEAERELREAIEQVRPHLPEQRQRQVEVLLEVRAGRDSYTAAHDMTINHHRGDRPAP